MGMAIELSDAAPTLRRWDRRYPASLTSESYSYDANGNLTSAVRNDGTVPTLYAWDYRNRLTDVTFKDGSGAVTGTIHYTYADNNNRISQTVKDASGSVTLQEFFVYDGSNLLP